jgi:hypothetical protein
LEPAATLNELSITSSAVSLMNDSPSVASEEQYRALYIKVSLGFHNSVPQFSRIEMPVKKKLAAH